MKTLKTILGCWGAVCIMGLAYYASKSLFDLLVSISVPEGVSYILAGAVYIGLTYGLIRLGVRKILRLELKDIGMSGFYVKKKWLLVAFLLPLAVKAIYLLLFSGAYVSSKMNGSQVFASLAEGIVISGITAGFVEEMVFRGVIMHLLKERWNIAAAVWIPSVLFAAIHIPGKEFSIPSTLLVLIAGTAVGIMFSLIALENGSIWASAIVHSLWNIIISAGLAVGVKPNPSAVMTYVLNSKALVVTGGEFGIESSLISLAGYLTVILICCALRRSGSATSSADRPGKK